jgi:hypothetical protein
MLAGAELRVLANLGVRAQKRLEDRPVETQRLHLAAGPHRRGPLPTLEQRHLSEAIPGLEDVERHLLAALAALHRPRTSGDQHIERVRLLALPHDHRAERERRRHEALLDELSHLVGHEAQ